MSKKSVYKGWHLGDIVIFEKKTYQLTIDQEWATFEDTVSDFDPSEGVAVVKKGKLISNKITKRLKQEVIDLYIEKYALLAKIFELTTSDLQESVLENTEATIMTHREDKCAGERCTIHNRSDHSMRSFPQHWRGDRGIMERICTHGIGHPDPDDLRIVKGGDDGTHGCDGCCYEKKDVPFIDFDENTMQCSAMSPLTGDQCVLEFSHDGPHGADMSDQWYSDQEAERIAGLIGHLKDIKADEWGLGDAVFWDGDVWTCTATAPLRWLDSGHALANWSIPPDGSCHLVRGGKVQPQEIDDWVIQSWRDEEAINLDTIKSLTEKVEEYERGDIYTQLQEARAAASTYLEALKIRHSKWLTNILSEDWKFDETD